LLHFVWHLAFCVKDCSEKPTVRRHDERGLVAESLTD
jgi:hypothetical protein